MKKDINVQLMDDLMDGITQTDAWLTEQMQNPEIREAKRLLDEALEAIAGMVPDEAYHALEDATCRYASAYETAAILYGIHVAEAMRDVSSRPSDLSRQILARRGC